MGLIVTQSRHTVGETVARLIASLEQRHIKLFARIDHAGEAGGAGLELGPEELLLFGDPRVGTLLMQADPRVGLELPLRILVWQAGETTLVGYRPPQELAAEYEVEAHASVLAAMANLLAVLVPEATA
jgi:uncharacterized protein (DUF302 family)